MAKQADLLAVEDAQASILRAFSRLSAEEVTVPGALGRVMAEDAVASLAIPPFANSSMDGFAVRSADTLAANRRNQVLLHVSGHIAAGSAVEMTVEPGTAARIMTGGPLPAGADAVVPFEEVQESGDSIRIGSPIATGACVRRAGQDISEGTVVLEAGSDIHYPQVGLLSAIGMRSVSVVRRPVVAILSTGDELIPPGQPLHRGQIYNSNSPMLAAAVVEAGGLPVEIASERDEPDRIAAALQSVPHADLIVTSGGASVGDHDYIKDVLDRGGGVQFWKVRLRPGKPLLFGRFGDRPVIGLPGNPTSAAVTFELFVRPAIRTMLGATPFRPCIAAHVDERTPGGGGRRTYVRVRLVAEADGIHAQPAGPQDSAMLLPLAQADGLLIVGEDVPALDPGDTAPVLVWRLPPSA